MARRHAGRWSSGTTAAYGETVGELCAPLLLWGKMGVFLERGYIWGYVEGLHFPLERGYIWGYIFFFFDGGI